MEGEVFVGAAQAGDEMVLEGSNGTLSGIALVYVGQDQLEVDVFRSHVFLQGLGGLIVQSLELRAQAGCA